MERLQKELSRRCGIEASGLVLEYQGVELDEGWTLEELMSSAPDHELQMSVKPGTRIPFGGPTRAHESATEATEQPKSLGALEGRVAEAVYAEQNTGGRLLLVVSTCR